jgi:uncharacterized metal-binding protein YceD (DUF177 family)
VKKWITFAVRFEIRLTVKNTQEYRIPYLGLKAGNHFYEFQLTEEFFDSFELSEINKADIKADVSLEKQSTMMIIEFVVAGTVASQCDHCGDDLLLHIKTTQQIIVKFGDQTSDSDDDILVLGPNEHEIDLVQYLYEYAHLALPARHVHGSESDCNADALKRLAQYKVDLTANTQWATLKNLNYEDPEDNEFFDEEE